MTKPPSHTESKPPIAFWGAGIFPDNHGSKGIPSFVSMLTKLSARYQFVFYSHLRMQKSVLPPGTQLRQPPKWCGKRLGYIFLVVMFCGDHFRRKFAVLHAHSSYPDPLIATLLGKLFRIPAIVGYNAGEFVFLEEINFGDLHTRKGRINRWVVSQCDRVMAVSKFHAATILPFMRHQQNLRVIYRGVDLDKFTYQNKKVELPLQIIQVSYHHPVKDQATLLKTFALISQVIPAHLRIVGPDFCNHEVSRMIEKLNLRPSVTLIDTIPHHELTNLLHQSDIMIHTARYEALGVAVLEAMACGVVNVGTHVGVLADLQGQCCETVAVGDQKELARKVIEIISDEVKSDQLRKRARAWMEEHDLDYAVSMYVQLYEELIHEN